MRPHKIIMKAFGPFAKETEVNFDAMGDSVYLISGETGSGKTTIFDGIVYALYGTASGGARSGLSTAAFHSDYAKSGAHRDEMRVTFEFSNAGRTYVAERRMYWGKRGDAKTETKESTLSENGNIIVHGRGVESKDDVSRKITEILGLDADQFRRIIMLAQGEFQKFLTAGSKDRGDILGKLYDNRRHKDFESRLKAASALLSEKEKTAAAEAQLKLNTLIYPEDIDEEKKAEFTLDHPNLFPNIEAMILQMKDRYNDAQDEIKKQDLILQSLQERMINGKNDNDLLDSLEVKQKEMKELAGREEWINSLRLVKQRAKDAGRVLPDETAMKKARAEWEKILLRIENLEKEQKKLHESAAKLRESSEELERSNTPQIAALKKEQALLNDVLPTYNELETAQASAMKKARDLKDAEAKYQKAQKALEQNKARKEELEKLLQRLANAGDHAVSNAKRTRDDLEKRRTDLNGIRSSITQIQTLSAEVEKKNQEVQAARREEIAAEEKHLALNKAYVSGQAGILAEAMRKDLQDQTEVVCPVCGTKHTSADTGSFAVLHEDTPTKDEVDQAFTAMEKAHKATQEAVTRHSAIAASCADQKTVLLEKTKELIAVSDWDQLITGTELADAMKRCKEDLAAANARYEQESADKCEKEKASADKVKVDQAAAQAESDREDMIRQKHEAENALASVQASVQALRQRLKGYPERKLEADRRIQTLAGQEMNLQKQIDDAKKKYDDCKSRLDEANGNLEGANSEKQTRAEEVQKTRETYAERMKACGFADEESYHGALSPDGVLLNQESLETWISRSDDTIREYDQKRTEVASAAEELRKQTKDKTRVDISAIEAAIGEANDRRQMLVKNSSGLFSDIHNDEGVLASLKQIQIRRDRYRKVYDELNPITGTANGKYAFSRYVLTGFFHRIVDQANIHLDLMTNGEYRLVPVEDGDGRQNIGLGLRILSELTHLERDTATLSGGQLFEASLSLALGLSDIVQMESTSSIQIDSMFIDEGFGSLDGARLNNAIEVLKHLSEGKRQIGIISHVTQLDECLQNKIHVVAGNHGSTVSIETDV